MFSKFLFIFTFSVLIFSSFAVGITGASVVVDYSLNAEHSNIPASIVYENANPDAPFYSASINSAGDSATVYLNTSWTSGIYADDNGNIYWITTSGNVSVYSYPNNQFYYLTDIPQKYLFSPFTSVAAVNYTVQTGHGKHSVTNYYEYIVLLDEKGYAYAYNSSSRSSWFNATKMWGLNLQNYPGPWVSVTSNVLYNHYTGNNESFFFVSYYGAVAQYNFSNGKYSLLYSGQNLAFVSSVANWNETSATSGELYGLEWNGSVYYFQKTWQYWGNVFGSPGSGAIGITIGANNQGPGPGLGPAATKHVFVTLYENSIPFYESQSQAGAPSSGGFVQMDNSPFNKGTVNGITYDNSDHIFYAVETNGTLAYAKSLNQWRILRYSIPQTSYSDVVSIAWAGPPNGNPWTAYAEFQSYQYPWNSLYFNVSFSSNVMGYEYNYSNNPSVPGSSLSQHVELSHKYTISVNYVGYPNMMGNSSFYFVVIFTYPMNSQPAIVIAYPLQFVVINHFYYMPVG